MRNRLVFQLTANYVKFQISRLSLTYHGQMYGRALISFYESNRRAQIHSLNLSFIHLIKQIIRHQPGFFRRRAGYHARYLGQLGIRINRNTRAYSIINSFSFFLKSLEFLLRIINRIRIIQGFYHSLINALLHIRFIDALQIVIIYHLF